MKIQFSFVGHTDRHKDIWVDLPQVPQVGNIIHFPELSQAETYVRTVVWYISHDDEDEPIPEPFVYVVIGPPRPYTEVLE